MLSRHDLRLRTLSIAEEHGERRLAARHLETIDRLFKAVLVIEDLPMLEVVMRLVLTDRKREVSKAFESAAVREHVLVYLAAVHREFHRRLMDEAGR